MTPNITSMPQDKKEQALLLLIGEQTVEIAILRSTVQNLVEKIKAHGQARAEDSQETT